jgi:predicted N-acyltransferase
MSRHELSYAIDVSGAFAENIDYGNRKQLKKCEREGLTRGALDRSDYESAYEVIAENRRKKGHTPSMTWAALEEMCDRMPDRIRCFGVRRGPALIAAAICLVINARTLYVFYWGEIAGVEILSPVTFLAEHIFDYCLGEGIALLDLGTATLDGIPNHGLIRYKRHLGCRGSLKLTMSKAIV